MKKTIAILLVLVIGMVGVWAAEGDIDFTGTAAGGLGDITNPDAVSVNIRTLISHINEMKITVNSSDPFLNEATSLNGQFVTLTDSTETPIAFLHTRSNNRTGYNVTMQADALKSVGSVGVADATIKYVITAYDSSNSNTGFATVDAANVDPVNVIAVSPITVLSQTYRKIAVALDNTQFAAAVAGEYTANITFTYAAN